jgi:hypothetical protein
VFQSVKPGGVWIVGRTLESDFTNHVTFLQKQQFGWKVITRIGSGSEIEEFVNPLRDTRRDQADR